MNTILAGIDAREKGGFPISIGTSLAIESACGVFPDRPVDPPPVLSVKEVWVNLRTLIRNLFGALPSDVREHVMPGDLVPAMLEDMSVIESTISKASTGLTRVVFYCCDYSTMPRIFPKAMLKVPKTEKQHVQKVLEDNTVKLLLTHSPPHDLRLFRLEIAGQFPHSFIITHLPVDLLARYSFSKLELLESHTGAIKPYPQWHTKLTGGKDLNNIPFNRFSLQVFGDNGHQFTPLLPSIRKEVLRLAEQDNWSAITTDEKIRVSLRKIQDPVARTLLLALL